jgi:hypothetical protein
MIAPNSTNSRGGAVWAWVPALLLGSMLLGLGVLAYIAIDDPHFALESNYYDKAVHWDRSQSEARDGAALGLQLTLTKPLALAADGKLELEVRIVSGDRALIGPALVELEAFPNAYASRVERVTLSETSPGVYRARLRGHARGLWELRFTVTQGKLRFHQSLRRDVGQKEAA